MCSPRYAPRLAGDRSWTAADEPLDVPRAVDEWERLRSLVHTHIAPVLELQPEPWARAMTFTRDLAVITESAAVALMPTSVRGPFEAPLVHRSLAEAGVPLMATDDPVRIDGGNVLPDRHGRLLIGVTSSEPSEEMRTAVRRLEHATGRPSYRVPLVGGRFPHVDMAISDLQGRGWLAHPGALAGFDADDPAWQTLFVGKPVVVVDEPEGERLGCNVVVGDDVIIGPDLSFDLRRRLESFGFDYHGTPLEELRKAGGGAHCLTLEVRSDRGTAVG